MRLAGTTIGLPANGAAVRVTLPRREAMRRKHSNPAHGTLAFGIRIVRSATLLALEAADAIRVTEPTPHISPLAPPQDLEGK